MSRNPLDDEHDPLASKMAKIGRLLEKLKPAADPADSRSPQPPPPPDWTHRADVARRYRELCLKRDVAARRGYPSARERLKAAANAGADESRLTEVLSEARKMGPTDDPFQNIRLAEAEAKAREFQPAIELAASSMKVLTEKQAEKREAGKIIRSQAAEIAELREKPAAAGQAAPSHAKAPRRKAGRRPLDGEEEKLRLDVLAAWKDANDLGKKCQEFCNDWTGAHPEFRVTPKKIRGFQNWQRNRKQRSHRKRRKN